MQEIKNHTKKKTTIYKERDEEQRERFIEEIKDIPLNQQIYLDESGMNRYLYRTHGRNVRGKQVWGEISGMRFKRESFIAGLREGKLISCMCFQGTCNKDLFNAWIKQVLLPELKPGQVIILDNASFHRSKETKELIEKAQCRLMFLPPYSPDLNPIEKYWANIKSKVRECLVSSNNLTKVLDEVLLSIST